MTEKRFIYIKLGDRDEIQDYIIDNNQNNHFKHKEYHFNNISDFEDLFDMLNNLVAENEQLKRENQSWLKTASRMDTIHHEDREYCEKLYKENEQLKQSIKEIDDAELHLKQIILKRIDDYIWEWEDEGTPVAQVLRELRDEIKGDDGMTVKVVQNEDGIYSVIKHNSTTTINCRHFTNKNDAINHAIIQAKREGDTDINIEKGDVGND